MREIDEDGEDKEYRGQIAIWGTFICAVYWLLFVFGALVYYEHPALETGFIAVSIMTTATAWILWALKMEREWNW